MFTWPVYLPGTALAKKDEYGSIAWVGVVMEVKFKQQMLARFSRSINCDDTNELSFPVREAGLFTLCLPLGPPAFHVRDDKLIRLLIKFYHYSTFSSCQHPEHVFGYDNHNAHDVHRSH